MVDADHWVFAYGSLMWRPEPAFGEPQRAYLPGYARQFCVYAVRNRGTPSRRGLVLGVVPQSGACVSGIAYRVPKSRWEETFGTLLAREQAGGAYAECWLTIRLDTGDEVSALVFVADRHRPTWAGDLTDERRIQIIVEASGEMGSNVDYALRFEQEIRALDIADEGFASMMRMMRDQDAPTMPSQSRIKPGQER